MGSIAISKLKGIEHLEFQIPDSPGVYLLVGKNGCGKSTLLTCLHRIGFSNAFPNGLPCAEGSSRVDQYSDSQITYQSPEGKITYGRRRQRWIPSPYKHAKEVLDGFGFKRTIYAQADQSRLRVTADDVMGGNLYDADAFIKETLNYIFDETKYSRLQRLPRARGRHSKEDPYLLVNPDGTYYSEKRFSSGELALLRLVGELQNLEPHSLILLDEAELALHPEAQRKLLDTLKRHARESDLTILVATHSTTLIANEQAQQIYLLKEEEPGNIQVVHPCYPAEAMESIDVFDSILGDYLILVEDTMAQGAWRAMCDRTLANESSVVPFQYNALPVGGYSETAKLAQRIKRTLPDHTTVRAVLDADAFDDESPILKEITREDPELVHNLGFTPEVEFVNVIEGNQKELEAKCRSKFGRSLRAILSSPEYARQATGANPRKVAKKKFEDIVAGLTNPMAIPDKGVVQHEVITMIVELMPLETVSDTVRQICHK